MTMRELWFSACGAWDVEVLGRAWWLKQFGGQLSEEAVIDMHPLRRLENPPPTPEQAKASEVAGWTILEKGLEHLNTQRAR